MCHAPTLTCPCKPPSLTGDGWLIFVVCWGGLGRREGSRWGSSPTTVLLSPAGDALWQARSAPSTLPLTAARWEQVQASRAIPPTDPLASAGRAPEHHDLTSEGAYPPGALLLGPRQRQGSMKPRLGRPHCLYCLCKPQTLLWRPPGFPVLEHEDRKSVV